MSDELSELKQKMSLMSDDQLLQMVTVDAEEYRKDALDCANAELTMRGIDPAQVAATAVHSEEPNFNSTVFGRTCLVCGGDMRPGTLIAENEVTVIFSDVKEERFVKVRVCSKCGQVSMNVDFENEVVH